MSTLHDRLADLADRAPVGHPDPGLWERGRRYGRRRRAAAVVLAVAILAVLVSTRLVVAAVRPVEVAPAGDPGGLRLPDQLFHPDPWAPDLAKNGPIGPLVAVVGAPRASWTGLSERNDVAGVNVEGEYVFLGLEGWTGDVVELSPDGRYVAYWYAADHGDEPGPGTDAPAAGIAVLDTVSGDVDRRPIDSRLGLEPQEVAWAGDRLWVPLWHYTELDADFSSGELVSVLVWNLATGDQDELGRDGLATVGGLPSWGDYLVDVRGDRVVTIAPDGTRETVARVDDRVEPTAFLNPTGSRVAVLRDSDDEGESSDKFERIAVADLGSDPAAPLELVDVPGDPVARIVGWRSDHEVVAYSYGAGRAATYDVIDVVTGERSELVRPPTEMWTPGERIATEALAAPVFEAPAPPDVHDPRAVLGAAVAVGLGAVALALTALSLRRRRVRA